MNPLISKIIFFSTEDIYLDEQHHFYRVLDAPFLPLHDNHKYVQFAEYTHLFEKKCVEESDRICLYGSSYLNYDTIYPKDHIKNYLTDLKNYFDCRHKQEEVRFYLFLHEKDLYRDGAVDGQMFNTLGDGTYTWHISDYGRQELNVPSDCDVYLFQHECVCPIVEILDKESIKSDEINEMIKRISQMSRIQLFTEADNAVTLDMNEAKERLKSIKERLNNGRF